MATNQEYKNMKYDRLAIWVPKGKRDEYKAKAAQLGLSLSMFIQRSAEDCETSENFKQLSTTQEPKLSAEEKRLLEDFSKLPADVQKKTLALIRAINGSQEKGGD